MKTLLIIGASRGIGFEMARQARAEQWQVIGTVRNAAGITQLESIGAQGYILDVTDANAAITLKAQLGDTALDVALINAGIFGPRTPKLEAPSHADFNAVMQTNVFGAMQLGATVGAALVARRGTLAVTSSRMGSIGARDGTAGWLYRASKAALNSVLKDMSLVLGPQGVTCVTFHPGWVKTDMGGSGADIDVATSVRGIRQTIAHVTPAQNGSFLNYDGSPIPW